MRSDKELALRAQLAEVDVSVRLLNSDLDQARDFGDVSDEEAVWEAKSELLEIRKKIVIALRSTVGAEVI